MILTDVDGVLFRWTDSFKAFLTRRGIETHTPCPRHWDLSQWVDGDHDVAALIAEHNSGSDFSLLKPFQGAVEHLHLLKRAFGFPVVAITCCGNKAAATGRLYNLESVFGKGFFSRIYCLPLKADKLEHLKTFKPSYWVEDNFLHARSGIEAGHRVFLIDKPYNRDSHHPEIRRVTGWREIYAHISDDLGTPHSYDITASPPK